MPYFYETCAALLLCNTNSVFREALIRKDVSELNQLMTTVGITTEEVRLKVLSLTLQVTAKRLEYILRAADENHDHFLSNYDTPPCPKMLQATAIVEAMKVLDKARAA